MQGVPVGGCILSEQRQSGRQPEHEAQRSGPGFVQELFACCQLPDGGLPHIKDNLRYPVIILILLFDGIGSIRGKQNGFDFQSRCT